MRQHESTPSHQRRRFLGTAAAGLAASAMAGNALGAPSAQVQRQQAAALQNPTTLYVHAPFPSQPQPWPGLASRMQPRPDHGEKSYRGSGKMTGRKVLITGGDSGLGRAAAIAMARKGADVAINFLPAEQEDANEVLALIEAAGRKAVALPGDLRSEDFCKSLVARAAEQLNGLDCLINCAGRQHYHESILDLSTEEFDWTLKTNLYALFWLVKAAIPHMPPGSSIVNTASSNSYDPNEIIVDYAMTKAAIANFTHSMAKQLIDKGIRMNAVAPGPFWTPLQVCGGQQMSQVEKYSESVPLGRPGQPAEIASTYVILATAESTYLTGQVFGITGGTGAPG